MLNIYIGFDQVESVAYHTLCHSILSRSSKPVSITPINLKNLKGIYTRKRDPKQSNEFSFSRFLVPYLNGYKGFALFMDCDMLVRTDINELFELRDVTKAVQVVKHDYTPKNKTKYLGTTQYQYPRKNWSSVMLFNCAHYHCRKLTPDYINTATGLDLHRFSWTDDKYIGELPREWNHLVSEYEPNPKAKIVHYTVGGPYFDEYMNCEFSGEWFEEKSIMQHCQQRKDNAA